MSKYAQGLQASDKDKEAAQVASQEAQAKASVDQFIASLQGGLAKTQETAARLVYQFPLDVQAILNANTYIKEIQSALDGAEALKVDLFS